VRMFVVMRPVYHAHFFARSRALHRLSSDDRPALVRIYNLTTKMPGEGAAALRWPFVAKHRCETDPTTRKVRSETFAVEK